MDNNINIDLHYSSDGKRVSLSSEDWQKILELLKRTCNVNFSAPVFISVPDAPQNGGSKKQRKKFSIGRSKQQEDPWWMHVRHYTALSNPVVVPATTAPPLEHQSQEPSKESAEDAQIREEAKRLQWRGAVNIMTHSGTPDSDKAD